MYSIKCPVENCAHTGEALTNNHCTKEHGMTKKEVIEKYGQSKRVNSMVSKSGNKVWNKAMSQR